MLFCAWASACGSPAVVPRLLPPIHHAASLPGACVQPETDAHDRLGPDADGALRVERTLDLDGDSNPDWLITHASFCGTGGCTWHVYVSRGTCGHWVGEVFGMLPMARSHVTHGLVELEIATRDGCGGMARTESRLRFDGLKYVPFSARKCRCPEGDETSEDPERWCESWTPVVASATQ